MNIGIKISTILFLIATILFGVAALSLGDKFPIVDVGFCLTALGLTAFSVGS